MTPESQPLLTVRGLTKRFPGVLALDHVALTLYPGEVLAVIGENGAGKSTLMKILAGVEQADSGEILLDGQPATVNSVKAATGLGISLIHQELNLADNLDVAANIYLGREPARAGFVDNKTLRRNAQALLDRLQTPCAPDAIVSTLAIGHQQMVEIAKALSINARILIMDEPTSSMSQRETQQLYNVIRELSESGVSIIYISHRLGEVKEVAHRVTVLRDGVNAGELARDEINHDNMVRLMVGRDVSHERRNAPPPKDPVFAVQGLRTKVYPQHRVEFQLHRGEIVGMAGLVGAGRTEILETIFGVRPKLAGTITVEGRPLNIRHAAHAIRAGIALVPEDRKQQGLILEMMLRENLSLANVHQNSRAGFLDQRDERRVAAEMIRRLDIRTPTDRQTVQLLSGGNQQKTVIGKWLALRPRILLMDEPTRGIDVGAKREIYRLMEELAAGGVAILFVSSEMEEILTMSDRVLVVHEGRLTGELHGDALTEQNVMRHATGLEAVPA